MLSYHAIRNMCLTHRVFTINYAKSLLQVHHKVKNIPNHRLPKQACNIGCKVQKSSKRSILSIGWVLDIMKWFKRWGVKEKLEQSGDVMKHVRY